MSDFPILLTFNAHPMLARRIREYAKRHHDGNLSAAVREVLDHVVDPAKRIDRVAKLRAADKASLITKPGYHRTSTVGASVSLACAEALTAAGQKIPLAKPINGRTHFDANDVARRVLESVFMSKADCTLMRTTGIRGPSRGQDEPQGKTTSVYLKHDTIQKLDKLLEGSRVSKSYLLSLMFDDLVNGTNTASRVLKLHPASQPERRSVSADAALA